VQVDLRSPRTQQAIAAAVVLLAFVADFRAVVLLAAIGLLVTFVRVDEPYRITWATEAGLLVVSTLLFLVGRAGWAWVLALLAAGIAALAAAADVWILPGSTAP
jgi:hypothetical protein